MVPEDLVLCNTMLRLGADETGEPLKVVNDQQGNPTSASAVAEGVKNIIDNFATGFVSYVVS